jgi:prepilin-type N-terminal cleavage/methylation domain-containing protein/prepilin-type processing-associated H-X9-DG protein
LQSANRETLNDHLPIGAPPIATRRYGRFQTCATGAVRGYVHSRPAIYLESIFGNDKLSSTSIQMKADFVKSARLSRATHVGGFTLLELLVVLAIIAILAALQIPVLARAKPNAQGIACLSNMKQLQMAALLYTDNNKGNLPGNLVLRTGGDSTTYKPNWVDGVFASPANGPINENPVGCETNPFYLGVQGKTGFGVTLVGSIGPYSKGASVYRCPGDSYIDPTYGQTRVRSCSANAWVGGSDGAGYKSFMKSSDFGGKLAASDCFVYVDENPLSLNDGWFEYVPSGATVNDPPAVNHGGYSSLSFADGHAELHEWHDAFLPSYARGSAGGTDAVWLAQHGTYALP